MAEPARLNPLPEGAVEKILSTRPDGTKERAIYLLKGEEIRYRYWDDAGNLGMDWSMKGELRHGLCLYFHENGQVCEEGNYFEGKEHGETKQYDWDGVQIGSYVLEYGTGVDLWYSAPGVLSEERHMLDGNRHGFERSWNEDNLQVREESHFKQGVEHGIFRQWNVQGKLRRGFPRYFLKGKQVTKRQYIAACRKDPTLPPFRDEDNRPFRSLPSQVQALKKSG